MKDLAIHTRVAPGSRIQTLEGFMNVLHSNQESQKELSQWNLQFDRHVLKMGGWTYNPERKLLTTNISRFFVFDETISCESSQINY